jgi:hypothetical protein
VNSRRLLIGNSFMNDINLNLKSWNDKLSDSTAKTPKVRGECGFGKCVDVRTNTEAAVNFYKELL